MGSGYINCNILKKTYSAFKSIVDDSLTEVTADMLNGVTSIGHYAFFQCYNLTSVEIPSSVTSIGSYAFEYCRNLISVTISNGVTSIRDSAFNSCSSLASITIPSSVTSISFAAFSSCSALINVTVEATTPPTLSQSVFNFTHADLVIYVPAESVEAYKSATNWSTYASKIQAIPSI